VSCILVVPATTACHDGITRLQLAVRGNGLWMWKVAANIAKKHSRTEDKMWSCSWGGWSRG